MEKSLSFAPVVGRVLIGAGFLIAAYSKAMDAAGAKDAIAAGGLPLGDISYYVTLPVEILGGLALILGFRTRIAALALILLYVVATIAMQDSGGVLFVKNAMIVGGLLQIAAFGAGRCSLDNMPARSAVPAGA